MEDQTSWKEEFPPLVGEIVLLADLSCFGAINAYPFTIFAPNFPSTTGLHLPHLFTIAVSPVSSENSFYDYCNCQDYLKLASHPFLKFHFHISAEMATMNVTLWVTFIIFELQNELYFGQALNHNSLNGKEWIRYILMFICRIYQKPSLGRYWVVNKCFHNIMYLHGWPHLLFNFDKRKGNRK